MLGNDRMSFDPFENRLARDIRNTIGAAFIHSVKKRATNPFLHAVQFFSSKPLTSDMEKFIGHRKKCLDSILEQLKDDSQATDFFQILLLLWGKKLYFEAHEWLEEAWMTRIGDEKKGFQALIQTAVALEHFEYNRVAPAKRLAQRAGKNLKTFSESIPGSLDAQLFINALNRILES